LFDNVLIFRRVHFRVFCERAVTADRAEQLIALFVLRGGLIFPPAQSFLLRYEVSGNCIERRSIGSVGWFPDRGPRRHWRGGPGE